MTHGKEARGCPTISLAAYERVPRTWTSVLTLGESDELGGAGGHSETEEEIRLAP